MSQDRNLPDEAQMHRAMNATPEQRAALRDLALSLGAAPELSEYERAFLDRPDAPESIRERVARAMWEAEMPGTTWPIQAPRLLRLADAALAVIKGDPS